MLNYSSTKFETDTLFLQPSLLCALKCNNCYVHEAAKYKSKEMKGYLLQDLVFDILYRQNYIITNQFTIALNDIVNGDLNSWWTPLEDVVTSSGEVLPSEFHITVNNLNCSSNNPYRLTTRAFLDKLTMLSVSHLTLKTIEEFKSRKLRTKLNWNVFTEEVEKLSDEVLVEIIKQVDHVYIIMRKPPLGFTYVNEYLNSIASLQRTISRLSKLKAQEESKLPLVENACKVPSIFDKIHVDGCFKDSIKFNKSGNGCSSNISRFQIWPDGTATGCAYNSQQSYEQKPVISLSGIVHNLKNARNRYEFSECKIPSALTNKNNKLRVIT